jgi:hypothetical protein
VSAPWLQDACSLVDAFRTGEVSPVEAVQAVLDAVDADDRLNAVCHVDAESARAAARTADVSLPFGGVPFAVKELEPVEGWPFPRGSKLLEGTTGPFTTVHVERIRDRGGAIPVVQTTSSEFGLVGYTSTKLHGTTRNPWNPELTPGGSSGSGSIRIPAGYSGGWCPGSTATSAARRLRTSGTRPGAEPRAFPAARSNGQLLSLHSACLRVSPTTRALSPPGRVRSGRPPTSGR